MATSGTAAFNLDLAEVVEEAFERCGSEMRTGYDLATARRSLNLMFAEWASRGINLFTLERGSVALAPGVATYELPADTVDLVEHWVRTGVTTTQSDLPMSRISVSTYAAIPNKLAEGRPLQIFIERLATPQATVWPVPDSVQTYTLMYWRLRRIQDAGTGANTLDVPFRFVPVMVAGLAFHLALKVPGAMERIGILKDQYDQAWQMAADEDRDRASVRFVPRMVR